MAVPKKYSLIANPLFFRFGLRELLGRQQLHRDGLAFRDKAGRPGRDPAHHFLRLHAVHPIRGALQLLHQHQRCVCALCVCVCVCVCVCMRYRERQRQKREADTKAETEHGETERDRGRQTEAETNGGMGRYF